MVNAHDLLKMTDAQIATKVSKMDSRAGKRLLSGLSAIVRANPRNSAAFTNRGVVYSLLNMKDAALTDFNRSIKIEETWIAYANRAALSIEMGLNALGIDDVVKALGLISDTESVQIALLYNLIGSAYWNMNNPQAAEFYFVLACRNHGLDMYRDNLQVAAVASREIRRTLLKGGIKKGVVHEPC